MSEATVTAILTQAPAIILALGTLVGTLAAVFISFRNAKKTDTVDKKTDDVLKTVAGVDKKTDVVIAQTNGNLHALQALAEGQAAKIEGLEKMIRQMAHPKIKPLTKVK